MATGTTGTTARQFSAQMVHYLRKTITASDDGSAVKVGVIPSGAVILQAMSGAAVVEVFNDTGTDLLDIGVSDATGGVAADDDLFATDLDISTLGFKALDESVGGLRLSADTTITATYAGLNSDATTGQAEVVICYVPDNDG
ncbi:hypothetical protein [Stappia indica]|uniref:hypothetical protein n=1 Tax=Stappia indica TaxID=538381 RepID=UPI001CD60552|nr:hypothetical protein [Stappia indica]MCA1298034.1 hypothetical protein [Stappia indica]